jgi:hypothetical protein
MISVALPAAASLAARMSTIDLAYQLRLGDMILRSRTLPSPDVLTYTAGGHPWTDQQWLAQVLLSLVWRGGGWAGLATLRSLLIGATFGLVFLACRAVGVSRRAAALLALASFFASMLGLALRPQLFAFVLFVATSWALATRRTHPSRVWLVPVLVLAWTNVHGSFFLGPLLVGLAALETREPSDRRRLLIVAGTSVAATLANPFGIGVYGYVVSIGTNPQISRGVTEWRPPTIGDPAGLAFFVSIAALFAWVALGGRRLRWPTLLTLGVFFAIGLQSARGTFWWDLTTPIVVAGSLAAGTPRPDQRMSRVMTAAVAMCVVLLAVAFSPIGRPVAALLSTAPTRLTARLGTIVQPGDRVFAPQTWASWFELERPGNPMFVDSRIEVFPDRVWNDYFSVAEARAGWQQVLDRWNVRIVVTDGREEPALERALRADPAWEPVYRDPDGSVFVRTSPAPSPATQTAA